MAEHAHEYGHYGLLILHADDTMKREHDASFVVEQGVAFRAVFPIRRAAILPGSSDGLMACSIRAEPLAGGEEFAASSRRRHHVAAPDFLKIQPAQIFRCAAISRLMLRRGVHGMPEYAERGRCHRAGGCAALYRLDARIGAEVTDGGLSLPHRNIYLLSFIPYSRRNSRMPQRL